MLPPSAGGSCNSSSSSSNSNSNSNSNSSSSNSSSSSSGGGGDSNPAAFDPRPLRKAEVSDRSAQEGGADDCCRPAPAKRARSVPEAALETASPQQASDEAVEVDPGDISEVDSGEAKRAASLRQHRRPTDSAQAAPVGTTELDRPLSGALPAAGEGTAAPAAAGGQTAAPVPACSHQEPEVTEPTQLDLLLKALAVRHPSIVREITETAATTLKFEYLQLCSEGSAAGGEPDKLRRQEIWDALGEEEKRDLALAHDVGCGDYDTFFIKVVEQDRLMRAKLQL